jgi:hypothetical protein
VVRARTGLRCRQRRNQWADYECLDVARFVVGQPDQQGVPVCTQHLGKAVRAATSKEITTVTVMVLAVLEEGKA